MLIHQHDSPADPDLWRRFATAQGFGHLVAAGKGRDLPIVVPTQYLLGEDEVVLHLAKPNPIWAALDENPKVLLSIAGDWAYIPSTWKAVGDEDASMMVPTTYYAAVQISGTATVLDEPDDVAAVLREQLADLEPGSGIADPTSQTNMLKVIRGIRISIEEVRPKFKFGGNVDDEHRNAIAKRLTSRNGPGDAAAARHIRDSSSSPSSAGDDGVTENTTSGRFELRKTGEIVSFASYRANETNVVVPHVETDPAHRGNGYAAQLMEGTLEILRETGRTITPVCPFAAGHIQDNPQHHDLVAHSSGRPHLRAQ